MSGPTMIMAPAVEPAASHARTQHASKRPSLGMRTQSQSFEDQNSVPSLDIPDFELPSFNNDFELDTSFTTGTPVSDSRESIPAVSTSRPLERTLSLTRHRTNSLLERSRSWFPSPKSVKESAPDEPQRPYTSIGETSRGDESPKRQNTKQAERSMRSSDSFASFAKRSWMTSSRSPSPRGRSVSAADSAPVTDLAESNVSNRLLRGRKRAESVLDSGTTKQPPNEPTKLAPKGLTRASSYLAKLKPSNTMNLSKSSNIQESDNSCASSTSSMPPAGSVSIDTCTSQSTSCESNAAAGSKSSNELSDPVRDVLWSTFKALDIDLTKSTSKQTALRIQQVQVQLLPVLRGTMNHQSNKLLRPEMLDQRTTILGKWWRAILDMLEGQVQQPLSAADRSLLLEAAAMIMMRTEWRQTTDRFRPLVDRATNANHRPRSWTESSESSANSDPFAFLADSAEHNIRTTFISNLMRQVTFVVDKMSQRPAPPNLVNFAGKTCAYAFFFAPGVADILVRLWGLTPQLIRRVADEFGLTRKTAGEANELALLFPPGVGDLAWISSKAMWDSLKRVPQMSLLVARVPWTGPWVSRWKGRDTDLFFIFCKYFHILSEQFVPSSFSAAQKAETPAFVLVQAQLLSIIDTTIHRQSAMDGVGGLPMVDSLYNADAAAMALPLPSSNMMRGMAENRLLVLLKDFLSDDRAEDARASRTFSEALSFMLKAATKKISQYDSSACFTLFDMLEEVLPIYSNSEPPDGSVSYIDWDFWLDVCKRISTSLNTMLEIRLLSFMFTVWDSITKDRRRKQKLCFDWLLAEDTFHTYFTHWCPMVRAYYHRLLCWRICRDEGGADFGDGKIFVTASARLRTVWGHYLYLKEAAEKDGLAPPSSAPMLPSPGKKFMIIRQEQHFPQPSMMMGFDNFARLTSKDVMNENQFAEENAASRSDSKKRWSIFGKVLSLSHGDPSNTLQEKPPIDDELEIARRETARLRQIPPPPPPKTTKPSHHADKAEIDSLDSPTLFDEPKFVFKFTLAWHQQSMPMRDRILTRPILPRPAQVKARLRTRSCSPSPPGGNPPVSTRTVSGGSGDGLINEAKNASPLSSPIRERALPNRPHYCSECRTRHRDYDDESLSASEEDVRTCEKMKRSRGRGADLMTRPIKPTGLAAKNAVYVGRALAEWGIVVFDCDNFVDRRREEGIPGLAEVEVPSLSLEGFRKLAG
ncbi:UPF0592 membrane protein [Paramyrothecium foliicola]|nr:UPF0592 membrane protein [Paramyrothecium foliicola]